MSNQSWGQKRVCSCGKIRFYDLNKKKIECPECAEIIDIDFLSNSNVEKNLFKKKFEVNKSLEENIIKKKKIKTKVGETDDMEKDTTVEIDDASKLPVSEIIGETKVKKLKKKDGNEEKD